MASLVTRAALLLAFLISAPVAAQNGTGIVRGAVTTAAGVAAAGVRVEAAGNRAVTGADGAYTLRGVTAGGTTLKFTRIGYAPAARWVDVPAGGETRADVVLRPTAVALTALEVTGARAGGYHAGRAASATRIDAEMRDVPRSVQTVSAEVLRDQGAARMGDLYRNASGLNAFSHHNDFVLRGFRSTDGSVAINGQRGSASNWHVPMALANVERVEVLKGPASILFGEAEPGGVVNMVTKRPQATPSRTVSLTRASFDQYQAEVDLTGPLAGSERVFVRAVGAYEDAGSFRDHVDGTNWLIAPSLTWLASASTALTVQGEVLGDRRTVGWDRGLIAPNGDLDALPISRFLHEPDDYDRNRGGSLQAQLAQGLGSGVTLNASLRGAWRTEDNGYHEPRALRADGRTLDREWRDFDDSGRDLRADLYMAAEFRTGPVGHRVVAGADAGHKLRDYSYRTARVGGGVQPIDIYAPVYGLTDPATYTLNYDLHYEEAVRSSGAYVQNLLTLSPAVKALVGARLAGYGLESSSTNRLGGADETTPDASAASALLPSAGLVLQPSAWLSLYGSFATSFLPQYSDLPEAGGPFAPERGRQFETGAKTEFFDGMLGTTLSAYRIDKTNVLVADPSDPDGVRMMPAGRVRSEGVEADVSGQLPSGFAIVANYAWNDARVTEGDPEVVGDRLPNAPRHQGSAWLRFEASRGALRGAGAALGVRHVGRRATFDPDFHLPGYTTLDAAMSWQAGATELRLGVQNLTDQRHFVGGYFPFKGIFPGAPRSARLSARVRL